MQDSRIRYKKFLPSASKAVALYFIQMKTAVLSQTARYRFIAILPPTVLSLSKRFKDKRRKMEKLRGLPNHKSI